MIDWISNWAGAIIVAVMIGTIIEMILPEGNSKKYIKVVIGIYVVFSIITPVINKFTGKEVSVSDALDLDEYIQNSYDSLEIQNTMLTDNDNNIMEIYSSGIKSDIKAKIEGKGYEVNSVDIEVANNESYEITGIQVQVRKKEENSNEEESTVDNNIEPVQEVENVKVGNIGENSDNSYNSRNSNDNLKSNSNEADATYKEEQNEVFNKEKETGIMRDSNAENSNEGIELSNKEKQELTEYLSSVYEVNVQNIDII